MTLFHVQEQEMQFFDLEVFNGVRWMSLNDHENYIVGADSFDNAAQTRKRFTVSSPMYDGEWEVHSTLGQVSETLVIYVLGVDQTQVSENLQDVMDAFSQTLYNVRYTMDDVRITWRCQAAEYSVDRSHINVHNTRAHIKLTVPRFPKVTREIMA